MALAAIGDVEAALGRALTAQEAATIGHLLDTASDRVVAYLGGTPNPVPGEVVRVVADVVVAVLNRPATTTADYSAGGYYQQREAAVVTISPDTTTNTGTWLSREQKARLKPFLIRGGGGMRRAYTIALYDASDEAVNSGGALADTAHRVSPSYVLGAPTVTVLEWRQGTNYQAGEYVWRNGYVYRANWWTHADPDGANGSEGTGMPWTRVPSRDPRGL